MNGQVLLTSKGKRMKNTILIIDFGTSKVHVNLIDTENGEVLTAVSRAYQTIIKSPGFAEIDPYELWHAAEHCVGRIVCGVHKETHIQGISFSYFGDSIMAAGENGEPLTNLILAFDSRAFAQSRELSANIGEEEYRRITGGICSSDDSGAKILWLKQNEPEIFKEARHFYTNQEFVLKMLGLGAHLDVTMASRKMLYDVRGKEWSSRLLDYIGISPDSLGHVVESMAVVGEITSFGSVRLPRKVPVIIGAHDCDCGMAGAGADRAEHGILADITGTWDHLGYISRKSADTEIAVKGGLMHTYCGPLPDSSVCLGAFPTSGAVIEWFMRRIVGDISPKAYDRLWKEVDFRHLGQEMFYPYFSANQGVFTGLGLGSDKGKLFAAIIEALTFEAKNIIEICGASASTTFTKIHIGGGASSSEKWLQLRADIFEKPVYKLRNTEISSLGAAILAMTALGVYETTEDAIRNTVIVERVYRPDDRRKQYYRDKFEKYKQGCIQAARV